MLNTNTNINTYSYKAVNNFGKVIKGSIEAIDDKLAVKKIQDMGYIPIFINQNQKQSHDISGFRKLLNLDVSIKNICSRISTQDIMFFTQDLSALLDAGLPLDRALGILTDITENEKLKDTIKEILKLVQSGSYLSDALNKYPKIFSSFYINLIKAGEAGGVLKDSLDRLAIFLENSQELKDYIKSALVYPIFLIFVSFISIIILMTYVIPKFSVIFSEMKKALPPTTEFLIQTSNFIKFYWVFIILTAFGLYFMISEYIKTPNGRLFIDKIKIGLPIIGSLVKKIEIARFTRTLGTLIKSGVPILQSIDLVKAIIQNQVIFKLIPSIYQKVKEGERLSKPLSESKIFPSLVIQMITIGEESGRLDEMLLRVSQNYEKSIRNTVKRFISFLEPAIILFMGLIVGFIVISMLMAIFSINDIPL